MRALFLLLTAASAVAQTATVSGTVRDLEGAPMPGASVYLSGTTRGDAANLEGVYEITDIAPGTYRLVASMVGFEAALEDITLAPGATLEVDLSLEATPLDLGRVEVEAERDERWQSRFAWFRRVLIGESERADSTRILNPEVLSFRLRWGTLYAEAAAPLVIENRALGYRLVYDLREFEASAGSIRFDGEERFQDLAPRSDLEAERWREERLVAYCGSLYHLMRALLAGTAEREGYDFGLIWGSANALLQPHGARTHSSIRERGLMRIEDDGWGTLRVEGSLAVTYRGEPEAPSYLESEWFTDRRIEPDAAQHSTVTVRRGRARIDPQGTPEHPDDLTMSGYFGFERLADRVPEDYDPP